MLCRHCQSENGPFDVYCTSCGLPIGLPCPACGHINRAGSRFCGRCSAALQAAAGGAAAPRVDLLPAADDVLRALSASGGERKRLTLLFADIAESTRLIDDTDPEDALHRLQPAIEVMLGAVEQHGGLVVRVQGDGVLALFGAPQPQEDHALRACAAALSMQSSVAAAGEADVRIRVGLNTGLVVARAVENSLGQLGYDVAGPAAHVAARMEQMAQPGEILMTGETLAATRQSVEAVPLGRRAVRGLAEPVEIFRVAAIRSAPASVMFHSRPRLSPLAGRVAELETLERALDDAARGEAEVVAIEGAAGAGKSRLCFEFVERCRQRGIVVHEARVLAHARATPYQPIVELLRDCLALVSGQTAEAAREQVAGRLAGLPGAEAAAPLLLDFVGVADPAAPVPKLDPAVRKARVMDLMRHLVRRRQGGPTVILIEDLHWIDPGSEEFIAALSEAAAGTSTLLVLNYRPGYAADWLAQRPHRPLRLAPLGEAEMARLLDDLLGDDPSTRALAREIADRAQGNPFFAEEMAQNLAERGDLAGIPGAYRRVQEVGPLPLPTTIEALLAARIDHLDETAKRVLQCAAVIGREVPDSLLEAVASLPPEDLAAPLERLRRAELVRELSVGSRGLRAFSHPLVQEVCYRALVRDHRRRIHGDVARALKRSPGGAWEERTSLLAYHLEEAGELTEAAQATTRTALWAGTHDSAQALRSWKKVQSLLDGVARDAPTDFLRMHACIQILTFGWREGLAPGEALQHFETARGIALASGNPRANAWIHAAYGRNLAVGGSADEYVARVREALTLAAEAQDRSSAAVLTAVLSQALRLSGHLRDALEVNGAALDSVADISDFDRQLFGIDVERWLIAMRGQILVLLGQLDEARRSLDRMLQSEADPRDITRHLANVAYIDLACAENDSDLAHRHAEQVQELAAASGSPYVRVQAHMAWGSVHILAGRFAEARLELDTGLALARGRRAGLEVEPRLLCELARAHALQGDFDGGRRIAAEALDVAVARASRIGQCTARLVQAEIALQAGDTPGGRDALQAVERLIEETGAMLYRPQASALAVQV